jgi:3-hydroxyisobutyrate dehydrogenase-like beta-hydroxyacid dehydrogenase
MVGLGRMGANMTRRLMRGGHEVVVTDLSADNVKNISGEGQLHPPRSMICQQAGKAENCLDDGPAVAQPKKRLTNLRQNFPQATSD